MALNPIDIPAGVYRHGTDLEGVGRWRDVNLVRWRNGSLGPIGGWQERVKNRDYRNLHGRRPAEGFHLRLLARTGQHRLRCIRMASCYRQVFTLST